MKEDYEDIPKALRKKYDEVKVPHEIFNVTNLDYKVRKRRMRFAASFIIPAIVVIVLIFGGIVWVNLISNNVLNENNFQATKLKEIRVAYNKLYLNKKCDYLSTVKIKKIEEYCIINRVAYTKVKVEVIDNYKNSMPENEYIYIPGGQFKASEIKELLTEEVDDSTIVNLKYNTTMFLSDVVEGQEYVVGVNDADEKLIVSTEFKYGFKKYNRKDNTVENRDNEYEDFVIEDYMLE